MKYLLDNNAWLWYVNADPRLGQSAKQLMEAEMGDCAISIVSLWEIVIKVCLGKLGLPGDVFQLIDDMSLEVIDLDQTHLKTLGHLKLGFDDPLDKVLAAQAITEKAWLVTADKILLATSIDGLRTIDLRT